MTELLSEDLKTGYRAGLEVAIGLAETCAAEDPPASAADVLALLRALHDSHVIEPEPLEPG